MLHDLNRIFLVVVVMLAVFGSHSQMAPAAAGNVRLMELGISDSYQYTTSILLNEAGEEGKTVGYQIIGDVGVSVVWESTDIKLLQFEVSSLRLLIQSRKAPEPEGFVVHKSQLQSLNNSPFLVQWRQGVIQAIYLDSNEDTSLRNMKKGIASLFQFQIVDTEAQETDSSGSCQVVYHSIDPFTTLKTKSNCFAAVGVPYVRQPELVLGSNVTSKRSSVITLSKDLTRVGNIKTTESHTMSVIIKSDAGTAVTAEQELTYVGGGSKPKIFKTEDVKSAIKEFEKKNRVTITVDKLSPEATAQVCSKEECPTLPQIIKDNRDNLQDSLVGTVRSANAFIKALTTGRTASKDELAKAFKGTKNKEIILQLCDLGGAINTFESHEVMKKILNFESEEDLDKVERYLWALANSAHPKVEIMKDLFKISKRPNNSEKMAETLRLTIASLARRFRSIDKNKEHIILEDIANSITSDLEECTTEDCKQKCIRAMKNLLCPKTIPLLIKYALQGKAKTSVEAMKTLRAFPPSLRDETVQDVSQRIYFQAGRKYDSSSRTLALDILLESNPRKEILAELISTLLERDTMFEVKQYLLQRLKQLSSENILFEKQVQQIMKEMHSAFNNYDAASLRGLTTAFTRPFSVGPVWNGSLVNIQEVSHGLMKRGIVDVILSTEGESNSLFTLGLFAGGLTSFVSSSETKHPDSNEVEDVEEEVATAGMELAVLGSSIRPFVFFSGQGELMGHVWSGTASEKTPAFQAVVVSHDHLEHISLQNGLVAQLQILGAISFDLSGQIQMSLWNRNAHSLVEQNAGVSLQGRIQVDTSFVKSQVEFNVGSEVKLNLISDLSFYDGISLCMQLVQPDAVLRHNIHKIERIIGSKHRLRKSKYKKINLPGRTYVLNQKNNEMCSTLFKDK